MTQEKRAQLIEFSRSKAQLHFAWEVAGFRLSTSYWYQGVDLYELEQHYSGDFMQRIYSCIAALEMTKFASFACSHCSLGPLSAFQPAGLDQLWTTLFKNIWAQWRYQQDRPNFHGPVLDCEKQPKIVATGHLKSGEIATLVFCGGGKDSLVAMKLLEESGVRFATFSYSRSSYGDGDLQHHLMERVSSATAAFRHHRLWIVDDASTVPALSLCPELCPATLIEAETPMSVFAALPFALAYGYSALVVGHERGADSGNLFWKEEQREINHQWGKSLVAEEILSSFLQTELIAEMSYSSVLKPLYDCSIFSALQSYSSLIDLTHSCNIVKPWCGKCAKCCYVLIGFLAYLGRIPDSAGITVSELLGKDRINTCRELAGLTGHLPFECVGEVQEMQLALDLCIARGFRGEVLDDWLQFRPIQSDNDSSRARIDMSYHRMPDALAQKVLPLLKRLGKRTELFIDRTLFDMPSQPQVGLA